MTWLWRRYRSLPLDGLDHECLVVRVVDLAIVLIQNSIGLIRQVWLVITSLRQDHNLNVLGPVAASFMHVFLVMARGLPDDYATRVTRIGKVHGVLVLVNSDNSTAAQAAVELCLGLEFGLNLEEARDEASTSALIL